MARYLVTGASGFVGRNLVSFLLQRGHSVRCLTRKSSKIDGLRGLDVEIVTGDIDSPDSLAKAVAGVDIVCHLAAITYALRYEDMLRVNGEGPGRLAAACAAQPKPPVLIHVSSIAAAGPSPRGTQRMEEESPTPISIYGQSKLKGEQGLLPHAATVPISIVRPGIIFGPYGRDLIPAFRAMRLFMLHAIPGFRSPQVSMIHVEDLCEIIVRAAEKGARLGQNGQPPSVTGPGVYFACADEHPTWGQMGRMCASALRRPFAPVVPMVPPLPFLIAALTEYFGRLIGKATEFNLDKWREATASGWACSNERIRQELGFAPVRPLQERLHETIDWYFANRWLVQFMPYGKKTPSLFEELLARLSFGPREKRRVSHPSASA
jgi:nucleoside-diphosphate-sugar epimerase